MQTARQDGAPFDFLSIGTMLKARPAEEAGERMIYLEAAHEGVDQQNEIVLAKALEASAPHFLRYGSLDIDHKSMPPVAARMGITDPESWEIGIPVDVKTTGKSVFVKARLYQGATALAEKANMVWESMTKLSPPARWYPSVGGSPLARTMTKGGVGVVTKVRWYNLALSRQPVNQHVAAADTVPFGALAKCWTGEGLDLAKALEAGTATDSSAMEGGQALSRQSLDGAPKSYFDFRNQLAGAIRRGGVREQSQSSLVQYSIGKFSLSQDEAEEWVGRFLGDLQTGLKRSKQ